MGTNTEYNKASNAGESTLAVLSQRLYDLFVVNESSMAYQVEDGSYRRRDVRITPHLIQANIRHGGSFGCYQQQYKTGNIRWICFDFDCSDKSNPDVRALIRSVIKPLGDILDERGIRYLTEFSGRRGIHVWVTFSEIIDKGDGYLALLEIERLLREEVGDFEEGGWHLDRFPATGASSGNVVGKQVKLPLSTHKAGHRSYFFCDDLTSDGNIGFTEFVAHQLGILNDYEENDPAVVMAALGVSRSSSPRVCAPAQRYASVEGAEIAVEDLVGSLSEIAVYRRIFDRLRRGMADYRDRAVLYGTVACFSSPSVVLQGILSEFPGYDSDLTTERIARLRGRYYPATFGYLHNLYGMQLDPNLDPDDTGFSYVLRKHGMQAVPVASIPASERDALLNVEETVRKEIRYLLVNDEASDAGILVDLRMENALECDALAAQAEDVVQGKVSDVVPVGYRVFRRRERAGRVRELVSLSAHDRVLTSHLALRLYSSMNARWDSFSYHPDLMSRFNLFSQWYHSWSDYRACIKPYLELPLFSDYGVFTIDLKGFYDHVDMLGAYRAISDDLDVECGNIFRFLVAFNDALMTSLHGGSRLGVPQGPAYARMIAEMHLDKVMRGISAQLDFSGVRMFRYVDDMVFFCEPGVNSRALFEGICEGLENYGLPVNDEKSRCYGEVVALTEEARALVGHENSFSYAIHENDYTGQLTASERNAKANEYLRANPFDIDSLGFLFGSKVIPEVKERCFRENRAQILASEVGRGINFKRFYRYLFEDEGRLETVVEEGGLSLIPMGSVNFSNFVNELYFACHNGNRVVRNELGHIADIYLSTIDCARIDGRDADTVRALLLVANRGTRRDRTR